MKMVDLAKQAFDTNNFDLSAEIYERYLAENGPSVDALIGLADSYARAKQLKRSFDAYIQAFRFRNISYKRLDNLVTALLDIMSETEGIGSLRNRKQCDPFACGSCMGLWNDPVTIQCGHTYCRPCLDKLTGKRCKVCNVVTRFSKLSAIKTNVLLARTVESWFPQELAAVKLKADGNKCCESRQFEKAVEIYSNAVKLAPKDHLLLANRSHALASLSRFSDALYDAEHCVALRPDWPKGYYRKAVALMNLSRHEEASLAYLQCLSLDPSVTTARTALTESLHRVLSPGLPEDVKRAELQQLLHPNPLLLLQHQTVNSQETIEEPRPAESSWNLDSSYSGSAFTGRSQSFRFPHQTQPSFPADQSQKLIVKCSSEPCLAEMVPTRVPSGATSPLISSCQSCDRLASRKRTSAGSAPMGTSSNQRDSSSPPTSPSPHAAKLTPNKQPKHNVNSNVYERHKAEGSGLFRQAINNSTTSSQARAEGDDAAAAPSGDEPMDESGAEGAATAESSVRTNSLHREVDSSKLIFEEFECSLCMRLIHEGATTPCGHTFCRLCLDRCLDHTPNCPLCKSSLAEYLAERRSAVTEAVSEIIRTYFPREFSERRQVHEEEISELNKGEEIPVFVCTMAYPRISCPLHVFEPRYRLMVRQCMQSGLRQFGMVACLDPANEDNYADYGTMLEIRDVQYFPDGRSVVDCIGGRRFKVKSRGHKHGYHTAKVEFLNDQPVTDEQRAELTTLHDETQAMALQWFNSLSEAVNRRIVTHFGAFPALEPEPLSLASGPAWHWWLVAVLPLESRAQLTILAMPSQAQRMLAIKRVIRHMSNRRQ